MFLHLHLVNVADLAFNGLDGLGLVYRLDVHGNRHFCVHFQKLRKELVGELRGHDLHIGGRSPCGAHAEQAAHTKVKAGRGDKILCPHPGLGYHIPSEGKGLGAAGVELAVKDLQPFQSIEGPGLYPQLFEIARNVGLHTLQAGLGNGEAVRRYAEGQQLRPYNTVVALGNLPFQHFHILAPHFAVFVIPHGDIELVLAVWAAPVIDEGELERKGAVKGIEKGAVAVKDGRLVIGLRQLVVDVLVFKALGIKPVVYPADTILEKLPVRDGLLCGLRPGLFRLGLFCGPAVRTLSFCARPFCPFGGLQSAFPPFGSKKHRNFRSCRA